MAARHSIHQMLGEAIGAAAVHADAFDVANANDLSADIIIAVALIGKVHEALCRGAQVRAAVQYCGHFGAAHRAVQTIRTEKQNIAGENLVLADVCFDDEAGTDGAAEDVFGFRGFQIFGGEDAETKLLGGDGVIAGEEHGLAAADQITSGVA